MVNYENSAAGVATDTKVYSAMQETHTTTKVTVLISVLSCWPHKAKENLSHRRREAASSSRRLLEQALTLPAAAIQATYLPGFTLMVHLPLPMVLARRRSVGEGYVYHKWISAHKASAMRRRIQWILHGRGHPVYHPAEERTLCLAEVIVILGYQRSQVQVLSISESLHSALRRVLIWTSFSRIIRLG